MSGEYQSPQPSWQSFIRMDQNTSIPFWRQKLTMISSGSVPCSRKARVWFQLKPFSPSGAGSVLVKISPTFVLCVKRPNPELQVQ